ncbi:TIGR04255 family protein [Paraburkholderia sp. UYCP14C]|uniref:TIGR04255 family protein n=1 Tax=Paraburkholderia sp. UYCP14C TaxID=2511130 RepID=UPI001021D14B|nr:TIGR04255 family protein [Paraburkholderia sp. UYCP14C]RZF24626.1 TIGR04255 family protein [Paraburkholderia sp. UYCP14C]
MTIDALHPFAGDHAVQSVAFVLEWATPLETTTLKALRQLASRFQSSFPVVQEQQQITVNVGEAPKKASKYHKPKAPATPAAQLGGIQFLHTSDHVPGTFTRMIQVQRESCIVALNEYSRWDTVWPRVQGWLEIVLPLVLSGRALTSLTLQYQDLFLWRDDPARLDLREIFRAGSAYLPPNCYGLTSAWHSHHGFVETMNGEWPGNLLNNINVNVGDLNQHRQIGTMLTHKATFGTPVWSQERAMAALRDVMPMLHRQNKSALQAVFSAAVLAKIGLTVQQEG